MITMSVYVPATGPTAECISPENVLSRASRRLLSSSISVASVSTAHSTSSPSPTSSPVFLNADASARIPTPITEFTRLKMVPGTEPMRSSD